MREGEYGECATECEKQCANNFDGYCRYKCAAAAKPIGYDAGGNFEHSGRDVENCGEQDGVGGGEFFLEIEKPYGLPEEQAATELEPRV